MNQNKIERIQMAYVILYVYLELKLDYPTKYVANVKRHA